MAPPDAKIEEVYRYPKPVDLRKSFDDLAALVELVLRLPYSTRCFLLSSTSPGTG